MDFELQSDFIQQRKPKIKVCFNKIFSSPYFQSEIEKSNYEKNTYHVNQAQQREEQGLKLFQNSHTLIKNQNNTSDGSNSSLTSDQITDSQLCSQQNVSKQMKQVSSVKQIILKKQTSIELQNKLNNSKNDQLSLLTRNHQIRSQYETHCMTPDNQNKQYTSFNKKKEYQFNKQKQEEQIQTYFFPIQGGSQRNIKINKDNSPKQSINRSIQENQLQCLKESSTQIKKKIFIKRDTLQSFRLRSDNDQNQTSDQEYFQIQKNPQTQSQQNLSINCIDSLQSIEDSKVFPQTSNNIQSNEISLKQKNKNIDSFSILTQTIKTTVSKYQTNNCSILDDKLTQNNSNNAIMTCSSGNDELSTSGNNELSSGNDEYQSSELYTKRTLKVVKMNKSGAAIQMLKKFYSENPSPTTILQKSDSHHTLPLFKNKIQFQQKQKKEQINPNELQNILNDIKQQNNVSSNTVFDQSQIDNLAIFDSSSQITENQNNKSLQILKLNECKLYEAIEIDSLQTDIKSQINQFITSYNQSMKQSSSECDNILCFTELIQNNDQSLLLYPLQSNRTLKHLLMSVKLLNEQLIKIIFKEILLGLSQLYQNLKCNLWNNLDFDTIFFDEEYKLRIGQKIISDQIDKDHSYLQKFSLNNLESNQEQQFKSQYNNKYCRDQKRIVQDFGFLILKSLLGPNYSIFDTNYIASKQTDNKQNNKQQSHENLRKCCIFHDIKIISENQINDSFISLKKANEILKFILKNVSCDLQNLLCGCLRYSQSTRFNLNDCSQYFESKDHSNQQKESVNTLQLTLKILFSSIHKKEQLQENSTQKQLKIDKLKMIKQHLNKSHQIIKTNQQEINFNKIIEKIAYQLSSYYCMPVQEVYSTINQKRQSIN